MINSIGLLLQTMTFRGSVSSITANYWLTAIKVIQNEANN